MGRECMWVNSSEAFTKVLQCSRSKIHARVNSSHAQTNAATASLATNSTEVSSSHEALSNTHVKV